MRRAVFIDRDGVIVETILRDGKPTAPRSLTEFRIVPGTKECVCAIRDLGFLAILVTNQPDMAYGHVTLAMWGEMQSHVRALPFDDIFVCFHAKDDGCRCRKPNPGMLIDAAMKWDINLPSSYMIGDTHKDMGAARAAGVTGILVRMPYNRGIEHDYEASSLNDAYNIIEVLERRARR